MKKYKCRRCGMIYYLPKKIEGEYIPAKAYDHCPCMDWGKPKYETKNKIP